jgi:hypothetical protein
MMGADPGHLEYALGSNAMLSIHAKVVNGSASLAVRLSGLILPVYGNLCRLSETCR